MKMDGKIQIGNGIHDSMEFKGERERERIEPWLFEVVSRIEFRH
jgi:hypothetical protein